MQKILTIIVLALGTFVLGACGTTSSNNTQGSATTSKQSTPAPKKQTLTLSYAVNTVTKNAKATLYKSKGQPIQFFVMNGYTAKQESNKKDKVTNNQNSKSYMEIQAVSNPDWNSLQSQTKTQLAKVGTVKAGTTDNKAIFPNANYLEATNASTNQKETVLFVDSIGKAPAMIVTLNTTNDNELPALETMAKTTVSTGQ